MTELSRILLLTLSLFAPFVLHTLEMGQRHYYCITCSLRDAMLCLILSSRDNAIVEDSVRVTIQKVLLNLSGLLDIHSPTIPSRRSQASFSSPAFSDCLFASPGPIAELLSSTETHAHSISSCRKRLWIGAVLGQGRCRKPNLESFPCWTARTL